MGRIKQSSLLADFNGAVGNIVVTSWRDQGVVKKKGVRRSTALSATQIEQNAKFALAITFISELGDFLETSYKSKAIKMTGKNAATRDLLRTAITGTYPNFAIDYTKVNVSAPSGLPEVLAPTATSTNPGMIHFSWTDNSNIDEKAGIKDKALLVAFCPSLHKAVYRTAAAERVDASAALNTPAFSGLQVHTWIVFVAEKSRKVSRGQYTGMVTVQ